MHAAPGTHVQDELPQTCVDTPGQACRSTPVCSACSPWMPGLRSRSSECASPVRRGRWLRAAAAKEHTSTFNLISIMFQSLHEAGGLGSPVMAAFPRCPHSPSSTAPQNPAWPAGSLRCDLGGWGKPRVANGVSSQFSRQHQAGSGTQVTKCRILPRVQRRKQQEHCGMWPVEYVSLLFLLCFHILCKE